MKKLKITLQNAEATEVLSRQQLKKIKGGDDGSGGSSGSGSTCIVVCPFTGFITSNNAPYNFCQNQSFKCPEETRPSDCNCY